MVRPYPVEDVDRLRRALSIAIVVKRSRVHVTGHSHKQIFLSASFSQLIKPTSTLDEAVILLLQMKALSKHQEVIDRKDIELNHHATLSAAIRSVLDAQSFEGINTFS